MSRQGRHTASRHKYLSIQYIIDYLLQDLLTCSENVHNVYSRVYDLTRRNKYLLQTLTL